MSEQSSRSKNSDNSFGEASGPNKQRPASPTLSSMSEQSSRSKNSDNNFGEASGPNKQRPASPTLSSMSEQSSRSKNSDNNFGEASGPNKQRPASPTLSSMSEQSYSSRDYPPSLSPLQTQGSDPSGQKKNTPEEDPPGVVKGNRTKRKVSEKWREKILAENEHELKKMELYSQVFEITDKKNPVKPLKSLNDLFSGSKKTVRTVLTQGEADVGKTFQTRRFMFDWANKKIYKSIDLIASLHFSELNARRNEVQSMEELLHKFFNEQPGDLTYDEFNVVFILDGLDKCELPLDFENNSEVRDIKTRASMDELLTNLIKGNLLPNALLWITSQPSGVDKIPKTMFHKVTECKETNAKLRLRQIGRKKILTLYKTEVDPVNSHTELYKIDENKEHEDKLVKSYSDLFTDSNKKTVRTVLTRGVAGIGKTFRTKLFMVDWMEKKSNKNIDIMVPLQFNDLSARRQEVLSMEDLLNSFFSEAIRPRGSVYDECKVAFVLDGLESYRLPLDFEKNREVTNIKTRASMDELLTNLIRGNLLPNALLWIISQPSGVDRIPPEHIQQVTECRETLARRKMLASNLKLRINKEKSENRPEDEVNHPNQKNTEHIVRETPNDGVTENDQSEKAQEKSLIRVNNVFEIFKDENKRKIRTVLTTGEGDIGKSFHVQKLLTSWSKSQQSLFSQFKTSVLGLLSKAEEEEELLFHFELSKLSLIRKKKFSLVGLLNHYFKETRECVISDYAKFNIVVVLDGLNAFNPSLNFDNNDILTDVGEPASVDMLLTNLIKGNLLPLAQIWITSQPSAAKQLPDDCVDRRTEIREKPDVVSHRKLKIQLKEHLTHVSEGIDQQKTSALLKEIYTDLYIIEGERGEVNAQHECRQVQDAKFKPVEEEKPIKYCDIFRPGLGDRPIKTVLTIGVAGIGKTFASMKYILDWAEGAATENPYYIFPLPFRELNLRKEEQHSFEDLIHQFFPAMKTSEITDYDKYKILIVLDGFDECRLDLEFNEDKTIIWRDVKEPNSVSVLLTNLIQGNLLPKAQIWVTSRPAASNNIPHEKVDRMSEVRGFNDEQKEEYFRKRFRDKGNNLAEEILSHVKKSRSLYIMCHIPVFCWIISNVLEDFVQQEQHEENKKLPRTLSDMYTYFLLLQCRQANVKYGEEEKAESSESESCWNVRNKETAVSLGKLAFEALEKGDLLFTEENLIECGIDVTKAAVFSGLFTQIKREDHGLYQKKLFCFVHLSIQEFLAALYVSHSFSFKGENLFIDPSSADSELPASEFYKKAVDKALKSDHGDWDLFLRFLLGLFVETNQVLLQELLKKTENYEKNYKETVEYIKTQIRDDISSPDKNLNLFHCLNELNDHSLVQEIKMFLQSETKDFENFTASQWSALTFVLLTSDEKLDVFDLKKYLKSEKVLLGMLPVVRVSKTALLSWCDLTEESCSGLKSSVLSSASSNLTVLDLSHNDLLDLGVQHLAEGLKSSYCKLEDLKLSGCQVTEKGCDFLASALQSNKVSNLKKVDLSYNHPGENGMRVLSDIADNPDLKLETICFDHNGPHRLKPGMKKYAAELKLDENTAGQRLVLHEDNRKVKTVTKVEERVTRPTTDKRFKRSQVFCDKGLKEICYWEVEWKGTVGIAVSYKRVGRKWDSSGGLGCNEDSWNLLCSKNGYTAMPGNISLKPTITPCPKIGVLLDWEGGTLSYYDATSENLSLIHTFSAKFTDKLFPAFWFKKGSVTLCDL